MQLPEALELVTRLIDKEEKHSDYTRTVDLADKYRAMITGAGIDEQLLQFIQREDDAMFDQRVRITKTVTPAVAASVRKPFNKVARNDRIKKKINLPTEARVAVVDTMVKEFFGTKKKKNKGLDYWMKVRFTALQFIDPNAWVVIEWKAPETLSAIVKPRPFEVKAWQAYNFFIVNDETKWLFVFQDIIFLEGPGDGKKGDNVEKPGGRFTLYDEDLTLVFEQIDKGYYQSHPDGQQPGDELVEIKSKWFVVRSFLPNLGFAPVVRIGYNPDEETDGRTFVNPWHEGLCYFEKLLGTVSELDLTMALHTFPQKLQYVQKCIGESKERGCNKGRCKDGTQCTECKGTGYKIHTTAQEAILLPMPDEPVDMIDLEKILVYKSPPIDLIKFQNEYSLQLERQVHQSVFNSQVFVKNNYSNDTGGAIEPTATGADMNMQSVYDTLEPFTEKSSEVWRDIVTIFAILAGEKEIEKIEIIHIFPADPKLKNSIMLMAERKLAKDSGAPAFLIETIDDDMARIIYEGDTLGLEKYRVKRRYFPFIGKNEEEIAMLISSQFVRKTDKILYTNFEQIFKELEAEDPKFYLMQNLKDQAQKVADKVAEFALELGDDEPEFKREGFGNPAGGAGGGEGGAGENADNPTE